MHDTSIYKPATDDEYTQWVQLNPCGWVINAPRSQNSTAPLFWHRADCGHIEPSANYHAVEGKRDKICSLDQGALIAWAFFHVQKQQCLHFCTSCREELAKGK